MGEERFHVAGQRTYLPTLVKVLEAGCSYIRRWRTQIEKFLPSEHHTKLDNVLTACDALVDVLKTIIIIAP